jgi:hypothetical protein
MGWKLLCAFFIIVHPIKRFTVLLRDVGSAGSKKYNMDISLIVSGIL